MNDAEVGESVTDALEKIENLLTDPDFLKLRKSRGASNLFSTLAVSHRELWHSAFVRWILNPQPDDGIGLGDFPFKRFLQLVVRCYEPTQNCPDLSPGDLEGLNLESAKLIRELTIDLLDEQRRIDIYGECEVAVSDSTNGCKKLRLIIENKILTGETNDQTEAYATWADGQDYDYDFLIFLTPFPEQKPLNKDFAVVSYDQFYQSVLRPCLRHPELKSEGKYLLEQYVLNLATPDKKGRPMANTRKEICEKIYKAHKEILQEIFSTVDEIGKVPSEGVESGSKKHIGVSLQNMIEKGVLEFTDTLHATRNGKPIAAALVKNEETGINIVVGGEEYASPSRAANAVTGGSINGWTFWEVRDAAGKSKGYLDELRKKVIQSEQV